MTRLTGELHPKIGFPTPYTLNIPGAYIERWDVLDIAENKIEQKVDCDASTIHFNFLNPSAGIKYAIRAWYRMSKEQPSPICESMNVTSVFGTPHIIAASWQDAESYDVRQISLQDIYLSVRTANIPPGSKLQVDLYDKEKIGSDKYAGNIYGYVNSNGIAKIKITQQEWLKFRTQLLRTKVLRYEDTQYQIYAKIVYEVTSPEAYDQGLAVDVSYTSPILIINNEEAIGVASRRIDQSNKSVVISLPDDIGHPESKKSITLKIRVYFDGTGNNMENINKMLETIKNHCGEMPDRNDYSPEAYKEAWERYKDSIERNKDKIEQDIKIDPTDGSSSYNQAYTNIPKMKELDKDNKDDEEKGIKQLVVYASGVGTHILGTDDTFLGMGTGSDISKSGIPSKVKEAMKGIKKEFTKSKQFDPEKERIEQVEVSAFGFSRGAATTRSFVAERQMLADTLTEILGVKISTASIAYKMVGIFDTVCSVTDVLKLIEAGRSAYDLKNPQSRWYDESRDNNEILKIQQSNVKDYNLAMGAHVEKVIHLTAADEYRAFFPLTNIDSSICAGVGYELELPGSHCDVGGGDPDFVDEHIRERKYSANAPLTFINGFVRRGWYNESDIQKQDIVMYTPNYGTITEYLYTVKRTVTAGYNRIPLRVMLHFVEDILKVKYNEENLLEKCLVQEDLRPLQQELLSFAIGNYGNKKTSAVKVFNQPKFNGLRKKYLHLSASPENGQTGVTAMIKDMARRDKQGNPDRGILKG